MITIVDTTSPEEMGSGLVDKPLDLMSEAMKHTGDATLLREVNKSAVLEMIRDEGPISRSEVARRLHLSPATITRIVSVLLEDGLVIEGDSIHSMQGRRPVLLEFNPRANLIIGVYVGQQIMGALSDLNGEVLQRRVVPSLPGDPGIVRLIKLIQELVKASAEFDLPIRGIGVGIPGVTIVEEGTVTWAPTLGWRNLPLKKHLEEALKLPVFVENEVNLIALGESWRGVGREVRNLACISLGESIGAGVIVDKHLYRGAHHAAGEIGYIIPNESCLGKTYDKYGCLESLAGGTGIVQRARERLARDQASILKDVEEDPETSLTSEQVLQAARLSDPLALAVLKETIDYLSIAVANLICVLDPELIVINGELAEFSDLLVEPIRAHAEKVLPHIPDIVVSELRTDAAVLGALAIAMHQTDDGVFVRKTQA